MTDQANPIGVQFDMDAWFAALDKFRSMPDLAVHAPLRERSPLMFRSDLFQPAYARHDSQQQLSVVLSQGFDPSHPSHAATSSGNVADL